MTRCRFPTRKGKKIKKIERRITSGIPNGGYTRHYTYKHQKLEMKKIIKKNTQNKLKFFIQILGEKKQCNYDQNIFNFFHIILNTLSIEIIKL